MDTNAVETESGGVLERVEIERRPTDTMAIIKALRAAGLPLDAALGLTLAEIGITMAHHAGENRWEVAGEICAHINGHHMGLGDWFC